MRGRKVGVEKVKADNFIVRLLSLTQSIKTRPWRW